MKTVQYKFLIIIIIITQSLSIKKGIGGSLYPGYLHKKNTQEGCFFDLAQNSLLVLKTACLLPKITCLPKEWKEANVTPVHKKDA